MIRITGGKFKQKKLASINDFVRPTSSLKREAFFSIIESYAIKNSIELYKNREKQENEVIDISLLPSGIYTVELQKQTIKFIKQ